MASGEAEAIDQELLEAQSTIERLAKKYLVCSHTVCYTPCHKLYKPTCRVDEAVMRHNHIFCSTLIRKQLSELNIVVHILPHSNYNVVLVTPPL